MILFEKNTLTCPQNFLKMRSIPECTVTQENIERKKYFNEIENKKTWAKVILIKILLNV